MLCGLIACCISGFVMTNRFGIIVRAVQCAYERIYYDSQFGQLKDTYPKWEGLSNSLLKLNESKYLIDKINKIEAEKIKEYFLDTSDWVTDEPYLKTNTSKGKFKGKYSKSYVESMKNLLGKCDEKGENIYINEDQLFYNYNNPDDISSEIGRFIYEVNRIVNKIMNKYDDIIDSLSYLYAYGNISSSKLDKTITEFKNVSEDLKTYQNDYLDKVEYYIKVAKACGYVLVMIYFSILCAVSIIGCALLMAYSYLKEQLHMDIVMHIIWNLVKFFIFSFFMYGAAFGMLFLGLRDIISFNKYLFGEENLNNSSKTYLLPKNESKEFLRTCLLGEKNEYFGELDNDIYENLNEYFNNFRELKDILKDNYILNKNFYTDYNVYTKPDTLRNLDISDITDIDSTEIDFTEFTIITIPSDNFLNISLKVPFDNATEMINKINSTFDKLKDIDDINSTEYDYKFLDSFSCGFLKSDLAILYNTLYDLSIESRILCTLSCCIAFFGEISIYFYLLSIYHYDKKEFKDGDREFSKNNIRRRERNVDISSRNEFLNKNKPIDMKKFNKKLDLEFDV